MNLILQNSQTGSWKQAELGLVSIHLNSTNNRHTAIDTLETSKYQNKFDTRIQYELNRTNDQLEISQQVLKYFQPNQPQPNKNFPKIVQSPKICVT